MLYVNCALCCFVFQFDKLVQIAHAEKNWRRRSYCTLKLWVAFYVHEFQMSFLLLKKRLNMLDQWLCRLTNLYLLFSSTCVCSRLVPFHTVVRLLGVSSMPIHTSHPALPGICRQLRVHACGGGSDLWALHRPVHEPHQVDCKERFLQTCQEHWR